MFATESAKTLEQSRGTSASGESESADSKRRQGIACRAHMCMLRFGVGVTGAGLVRSCLLKDLVSKQRRYLE